MITISSGHGLKVRGAAGPEPWGLDEVDEAIRVMNKVAAYLRDHDVDVKTFTDTVSTTQDENLRRITDWHNSIPCELACSLHFNAYQVTAKPMGCEVLYVSQEDLAGEVSEAIADAGDFIDRGPKLRTDLYFLNNTAAPAILIETCFVDSQADAGLYRQNFDVICAAIAGAIAGEDIGPGPSPEPEPDALFYAKGTCSWFGGRTDDGVDSDEGLAFFYNYEDAPHLFYEQQPEATTGLARRLNSEQVFFIACRWNYDLTPKEVLRNPSRLALVRAGDKECYAWPGDYGPHENTNRIADLSLALMAALEIETDDIVEIIYPAP